MTAKEYCQFVEWDATEELISMLQDFATIKCKEQRELCWRELNKKVYMAKDYTKNSQK